MKNTSRRKFILASATAGIGSVLVSSSFNDLFAAEKRSATGSAAIGFDQQPLPYAYNAIEPSIDAMTMEIHYTKHAAAYSKNLKEAAAAEGIDTGKPLEDIFKNISKYSAKVRNNAGGHYNHELFWKCLSPKATEPGTKLAKAFTKEFDSIDEFKKQFSEAAKTRFGSGWAWLVLNDDKKLVISSTPNQDNPMMNVAEVKGKPVFGLDVWEHAYYLKYQNRRPEYIENFWKVINWDFISERYDSLLSA